MAPTDISQTSHVRQNVDTPRDMRQQDRTRIFVRVPVLLKKKKSKSCRAKRLVRQKTRLECHAHPTVRVAAVGGGCRQQSRPHRAPGNTSKQVRMDGWIDRSFVRWMDRSIDRCIDGSMDGSMGGSMDGSIDRWMGGWVDGWIDRWMDRWMDGWIDR